MYYIKHIYLKDIRGFEELNLSVTDEGGDARKRSVILGKNGTCKTTLLRCIAIGLCDIGGGNALISENIVSRLVAENRSEAIIEIELVPCNGDGTPHKISTTIENKSDSDLDTVILQKKPLLPDEGVLVCGYGVGRHSASGGESGRAYRIIDSVYTLFEYQAPLIDSELTLRRLKDFLGTAQYEHTKARILKTIGLTSDDDYDLPRGGGIEFFGPSVGKHIRLEGLADGHRLTFSWILDLYGWAMRANAVDSSGSITGILLVDELEQHTHPSLQVDMLGHLSDLLPNLQIFTTTHSPLVALGATPQELTVLRKDHGHVYAEPNVPDFRGYSAEDMLVDNRLFNSTVYSPETSDKLKEYRGLAEIPKNKRTKTQKEKLSSLAQKLREHQVSEVIDTSLADELRKFREKFDL